jgi:hypothetical protein
MYVLRPSPLPRAELGPSCTRPCGWPICSPSRVTWMRCGGGADAGDSYAAERLADLLARQGHVDEAIVLLWRRADAGDKYMARRLVDLLAEHRR